MDEYRIMNEMTPFEVLCYKLKTHYRSIDRIERRFLITCISYIVGYTLLFLGYLVASGTISFNFVHIPLIFFPIVSLIITVSTSQYYYFYIINNESFLTIYYMQFNRRTVLHGLVFLLVQCFPIIIGVSLFYTQNNACSADDDPKAKKEFCFFSPISTIHYAAVVLLLTFLILFSTIYSIFLYYFWSREIWPIIHKQSKSKHKCINGK